MRREGGVCHFVLPLCFGRHKGSAAIRGEEQLERVLSTCTVPAARLSCVPALPQQGWPADIIGNALLPRIIPCQLSTPSPHRFHRRMPCKERTLCPLGCQPALQDAVTSGRVPGNQHPLCFFFPSQEVVPCFQWKERAPG